MGIQGLLPALKPVTVATNIKELKGNRVGVDTYTWLHKGVYCCATDLCQGTPTDKHIQFVLWRLDLLLFHGVKPYLVFDGANLPAKAGKESERLASREQNRLRGEQCLREGDVAGSQAYFAKAVDVTPAMAAAVIKEARKRQGVRCVVAPYEADAQLGYMCRNGMIDAVISEDSDLLLFGCHRVLFKMDREGDAQSVSLSDVMTLRNDEFDMRGRTEDTMLLACVLSGCDYLPSLSGLGLKKAYGIAASVKGDYARALRALRYGFGTSHTGCTDEYAAGLRKALATFRYQRVFCPTKRCIVHMTPLPENILEVLELEENPENSELDFLGPHVPDNIACAIAEGWMDPGTQQPFPVETVALKQTSGLQRTSSSAQKKRVAVPKPLLKGQQLLTHCFGEKKAPTAAAAASTQPEAAGANTAKTAGTPPPQSKPVTASTPILPSPVPLLYDDSPPEETTKANETDAVGDDPAVSSRESCDNDTETTSATPVLEPSSPSPFESFSYEVENTPASAISNSDNSTSCSSDSSSKVVAQHRPLAMRMFAAPASLSSSDIAARKKRITPGAAKYLETPLDTSKCNSDSHSHEADEEEPTPVVTSKHFSAGKSMSVGSSSLKGIGLSKSTGVKRRKTLGALAAPLDRFLCSNAGNTLTPSTITYPSPHAFPIPSKSYIARSRSAPPRVPTYSSKNIDDVLAGLAAPSLDTPSSSTYMEVDTLGAELETSGESHGDDAGDVSGSMQIDKGKCSMSHALPSDLFAAFACKDQAHTNTVSPEESRKEAAHAYAPSLETFAYTDD